MIRRCLMTVITYLTTCVLLPYWLVVRRNALMLEDIKRYVEKCDDRQYSSLFLQFCHLMLWRDEFRINFHYRMPSRLQFYRPILFPLFSKESTVGLYVRGGVK